VSAPAAEGRAPSGFKKLLASLVSALAITALAFALVGLLTSDTVAGLLAAGVLFAGGGVALARLSWRLYRGTPGAWRMAEGRSPQEVEDRSRELARRQWLTVAKFLLGLVPVYLLLALLLEGSEAGVGAAALTAMTAGGLGLLSWFQGRRER
jgi:hypothetical protein